MTVRSMYLLLLTVLLTGTASAQDVPVTFEVDMAYLVETGRFDPETESVDVAGSFNGWGATLTELTDADGDLVYQTTVGGFSVGEQIEFKFRINGAWDGREEYPGGGGNRQYTVQADDNVISVWYNDEQPLDPDQVDWWNDAVFYEIFVRSFYDSDGDGIGDINGIIEKLDYLNDGDPETDDDLGVTGLWLMPINPSPSYHGYDVTDYRGVNPDYGTMDDMRRLLDEAHQRGIRIIIDYVMNHSSDEHPWFEASADGDADFRDFYRWSETNPGAGWHRDSSGDYYYGWFWSGMPDLNYRTPAVRDSIFSAARFWLEDVGVDGFRLDAVKFLVETDGVDQNTEETFDVWADFSAEVKDANPDAFTVGEAWDDTPIARRYVTDGQLDYVFEFELATGMVAAVQEGDATELRDVVETVYRTYPFLQFGTFLTNHDQDRVMSTLEGDVGRNRAAAALYMTLPGVPYIYYGEEIGQRGVKPDEDIRRPMQWNDAANAGFTTSLPWRPPASGFDTLNVEAQQADPASLWNWYRTLIGLRNEEAALRVGTYAGVGSSAASVMAFVREHEGETLLVMVNTAEGDASDVTIELPLDVAEPGMLSLANLIAGDTLAVDVDDAGSVEGLGVPGHGARVYRLLSSASTAADPLAPSRRELVLRPNYPNPAGGLTTIEFALPTPGHVRLEVYDVLGRRVATLVDAALPAGPHTTTLDAGRLSSGVYYYRVEHAGAQQTQRMVVR